MQLVIPQLLFEKFLDEINGIDESKELVAAEDYNTWLRIAKLTDQFVYLKRLGYYLVHDQSVSKKDMSIPARYAIKEFLGLLTQYQKQSKRLFKIYFRTL